MPPPPSAHSLPGASDQAAKRSSPCGRGETQHQPSVEQKVPGAKLPPSAGGEAPSGRWPSSPAEASPGPPGPPSFDAPGASDAVPESFAPASVVMAPFDAPLPQATAEATRENVTNQAQREEIIAHGVVRGSPTRPSHRWRRCYRAPPWRVVTTPKLPPGWCTIWRGALPRRSRMRTYTARLIGSDARARPARRRQHVGQGHGQDGPRRGDRGPPHQGLRLGPGDHRARGASRRAPRAAPAPPRARRDDRRGDGQRAAARTSSTPPPRRPASRRCSTRSCRRASWTTRTPTPSWRWPISPTARRIFASLFGKGLVWIPYVMPGFALAKRCVEEYERVAAHDEPTVMVLERHGLFTWGATARGELRAHDRRGVARGALRGRPQRHGGA